MSDEINLGGKRYVSSKRAAEESGYAQDYIGQLARGGHIDAQRISGLWYINVESLLGYKKDAAQYVPQPPQKVPSSESDALVFFDGMEFISAARAAEITGYHADYVGQLARSGAVMSRQVGNRWYVVRSGILAHKNEKDGLLAAVQTEAVGIYKGGKQGVKHAEEEKQEKQQKQYTGKDVGLMYTKDDRELMPRMPKWNIPQENAEERPPVDLRSRMESDEGEPYETRRILHRPDFSAQGAFSKRSYRTMYWKNIALSMKFGLVAAAFVVAFIGFNALRGASPGGANTGSGGQASADSEPSGDTGNTMDKISGFLEQILSKDIVYRRPE